MLKRTTYLLLVVALTLPFKFCHAQMIFDTLQLFELDVVASQSSYDKPTKHHAIDSVYKKQLDHLDLGELLSSCTPVFIRSYGKGTLSTASFRGTGASHTQVLWNGFRLNSAMLGQVDLSTLPNSLFDRIELFYGGASLIHSEGGFGGGINLINSHYRQEKPMAYLTQTYGSFNTFSTAAGMNLSGAKLDSDTRVILQASDNDFTFYNDAVFPGEKVKQQQAAYRNIGFTQQFTYRPAKHQTISLTTWNQWNKRDIPPLMPSYYQHTLYDEYSDEFFSRNVLSWTRQKGRSMTEVKTAYFYENYSYNKALSAADLDGNDSIIRSENQTSGIFLNATHVQELNNGFVLTGKVNLESNQVNSNNYPGLKDRRSAGLMLKTEKQFFERLTMNLLVRTQLTEGRLLPLMPLFGLNYRILRDHQLFVRASISRNYHLPTLNDLYWNPGGNPELEPEDGLELEGGLNYMLTLNHKVMLKADGTVYASRVSNWIQWVEAGNGFWSPENVRSVFARGLELFTQLDARSGRSWYRLFLQYAYTRTTDESDQDQLIYIPEHAANGYFQWSWTGYFFEWKTHFVGEQQTIGRTLPSFLLNDVSMGKIFYPRSGKLEIRFRVNNLLDESYQAVLWRPMPGRNYELYLSFQLKHRNETD